MNQEENVIKNEDTLAENADVEVKNEAKTDGKKPLSKKAKIGIISGVSVVLVVAIVFGILAASGLFTPTQAKVVDPIDDNYRTFYQVFVGSFSDSNGDGIGDLRGLINRIDYLNDGDISSGNDLGVQGLWLSPIFTSPTYHKYDTTNYYEIDPKFGTEEDLKELIRLCDERNVKVILDLVINHTSDSHPWFTEFRKARRNGDTSNKYYYYYSCASGADRVGGRTYQKIPGIDYYYECNFTGAMPELNYDNPKVKEEMLNVAKYYLDLGISGFRFDAVKYIYYNDHKASAEFWEWYMSELRAYKPDVYCVGECWDSEPVIAQYLGGLNCFNFANSGPESYAVKAAKGDTLGGFLKYIDSYQEKIHAVNPEAMPIQFLSNHDQDRIAGTFIYEEQMKMLASLYLLSPGSPFIYYGEEIGIRGSRGGASTDANRRLAMLWGDGDTIADPEGSTYPATAQVKATVQDQLAQETSMLNHYSKLIGIRNRYPAIARGEYTAVSQSKTFGGFLVEYNDEVIGIFHNTNYEPITIDLSTIPALNGHAFSELLDYVGVGDATLDGTMLTLGGQTSVILQ